MLKYLCRYVSLPSVLGLKVQKSVSAQARSPAHRTHILIPPWLQATHKYLRVLKKGKERNTQKLEDNEDQYLFLIIQKVLRTNSHVFTCEILSFQKLVINVAHTTGMATLSKFVQQEEYFLGNKVKILVFN